MTTTFSKSPSPKTTSTTSSFRLEAIRGLAFGAGTGTFLCLVGWLSPLAAGDRPALALLAATLSLPLGCLVARHPSSVREAGGIGIRAVVAALALSIVVSLPEPQLWVRVASWCLASCLLGAAVGSSIRGAGPVATCVWLFLCGLPFFFQHLPVFRETAEEWALHACPWLGFSMDAFGGDPLRRPLIYMGHWTELTGATSLRMLQVSTLWFAAVLTLASLIVSSSIGRKRGETEAAEVSEQPAGQV